MARERTEMTEPEPVAGKRTKKQTQRGKEGIRQKRKRNCVCIPEQQSEKKKVQGKGTHTQKQSGKKKAQGKGKHIQKQREDGRGDRRKRK